MPVYPQEQYPAEGAILALNGESDVSTGLAYIARGTNANSTPSYEIQYNRRLHRLNNILAPLRQGAVVDEGSLRIGVYPMRFTINGVRQSFDGASGVDVADNATTRVFLDAAGTLQLEADFPGDLSAYLPLATIVTAAGSTTVTDERGTILFTVI